MTAVYIAGAVAAVLVVVVVYARRGQRSKDGVDSFRRQIDALSSEARRPVVDQVQSVAPKPMRERRPEVTVDPDVAPEPTSATDGVRDATAGGAAADAADDPNAAASEDVVSDAPSGEDGPRGT